MAYDSDPMTRRTIGPAFASAVIGLVVGVAAVIGIINMSTESHIPQGQTVSANDALLGGAEYGARS
ncbi:MAG: DUF2613 domain-containing protein [Corynebacterium sp.]|nr:DUF2613 domain-containing protein [Corynebacterium sp.]